MPNIAGKHFQSKSLADGELFNLTLDQFPCSVYGWGYPKSKIKLKAGVTHYCFVQEATAELSYKIGNETFKYKLTDNMYFQVVGDASIVGGKGIVISSLEHTGLFFLGGPVEKVGRLKYIDGCSDSLIIPPTVKGDPCLNHLHFPKGIHQTRHTHPSYRIGIVISGHGHCSIPDNTSPDKDVLIPLEKGSIFLIPTDGIHSFITTDSEMDVIAYHPDTDVGPEHDNHPMINRTLVDGVSAAQLDHLKTK